MVLKVGTDFGTCLMAKYGRPAWKFAVEILTGKGLKKDQRHERPKMRYSIGAIFIQFGTILPIHHHQQVAGHGVAELECMSCSRRPIGNDRHNISVRFTLHRFHKHGLAFWHALRTLVEFGMYMADHGRWDQAHGPLLESGRCGFPSSAM